MGVVCPSPGHRGSLNMRAGYVIHLNPIHPSGLPCCNRKAPREPPRFRKARRGARGCAGVCGGVPAPVSGGGARRCARGAGEGSGAGGGVCWWLWCWWRPFGLPCPALLLCRVVPLLRFNSWRPVNAIRFRAGNHYKNTRALMVALVALVRFASALAMLF